MQIGQALYRHPPVLHMTHFNGQLAFWFLGVWPPRLLLETANVSFGNSTSPSLKTTSFHLKQPLHWCPLSTESSSYMAQKQGLRPHSSMPTKLPYPARPTCPSLAYIAPDLSCPCLCHYCTYWYHMLYFLPLHRCVYLCFNVLFQNELNTSI